MSLAFRIVSLVCFALIIYWCWGEESIAHRIFPSVPAEVSLTVDKASSELTLPSALGILAGVIVLSIIAFIFFKIKILPHLSAKLTNLLTGQDDVFSAEDDELHHVLQGIEESDNPKDLSELDLLCQRRGARLRHWTEYANLLRTRCRDSKAAIEVMQRAIRAVPSDEDKALLLYRIAGIYEQDLDDKASAQAHYEQAAEQYPRCSYGKMAKKRC